MRSQTSDAFTLNSENVWLQLLGLCISITSISTQLQLTEQTTSGVGVPTRPRYYVWKYFHAFYWKAVSNLSKQANVHSVSKYLYSENPGCISGNRTVILRYSLYIRLYLTSFAFCIKIYLRNKIIQQNGNSSIGYLLLSS